MSNKRYVLVEIDADWQRSDVEEARWVREALRRDHRFAGGSLIRTIGADAAVQDAQEHSVLANLVDRFES